MHKNTHGPDVAGLGGGAAAGGVTGAGAAVAGGGATASVGGVTASGGGISTCFQSCPSSTIRAMRVPRRTLRLPSSICRKWVEMFNDDSADWRKSDSNYRKQ